MILYNSNSEEETLKIGEEIGKQIKFPRVIMLYGELGSGKTVFTRGLALGLAVDDPSQVRSPSFTLVNEYPTNKGLVYHIDLYRIEGLRDLHTIDIEEILSSPSVVIVEWAEKLFLHPKNPLKVSIYTELKTDSRRVEIEHLDN